FNEQVMTYFSAARGYKAGGFNLDRVQSSNGLSSGGAGLTDDGRTLYQHESRGRDTTALGAIDTPSRRKTGGLEDPRA
ncbi:hypothetical protein RCK87_27055, partial [Salmonella enterica subsp. enterica serovar 1,4,[5],12:i:-]